MSRSLPDIPPGFTLPFYYGSLVNFEAFHLVDAGRVEPFLAGGALAPALFDGKALAGYDFQLYTANFSSGADDLPPDKWAPTGASITQEVEVNIVVYPSASADEVPDIGWRDYVMGEDQTKLLGHKRIHVPCDAPIAIEAGETLFGEPKFRTTFAVNMPALNPVRVDAPGYEETWLHRWGFRVNDPGDATKWIVTCESDLSGLVPAPSGASPITEYGSFGGQPIGCRWNIFKPFDTYFLDPAQERVRLAYGDSQHPMRSDMLGLFGGTVAVAARTSVSAPVATQSRAYYL